MKISKKTCIKNDAHPASKTMEVPASKTLLFNTFPFQGVTRGDENTVAKQRHQSTAENCTFNNNQNLIGDKV